MTEMKTFKEWVTDEGYVWTGEEHLLFGLMDRAEASAIITRLRSEGRIKHVSE